ncbi:ATP-binding cassette domain-containing protein [Sporosarcina highlanderae]|uniref:ABC transporter ATP-binding protein n=1 Tax=Sporosarcina highlanderae TaxID=3035916 RepID=A0ABT8JNC9_9BACL|nr:ABC transporter ATP-binding protein [Sporosarcina highlanderae]MDN4606653.1 ABC transporter ATP-binding protein [Sporosarcina highlanderae]
MLEAKGLSVEIKGVPVVHGSSFLIPEGKVTALIGESGSGKSMTVSAMLGMLPASARAYGEVFYKDLDLLKATSERKAALRKGEFFTIFQDALNSFNPSVKMERQLYAFSAGRVGDNEGKFRAKMPEILSRLSLSADIMDRYPFELSGGMLQRCMIACALYMEPVFLIADEPTSALDKVVQKEFIKWLRVLNEGGTTVLIITHDLDIVADVADEMIVMRKGEVVETGSVEDVLANPMHEYTKRLLDSRF